MFRVICAWCGKVEREGAPGADVSHTICETCFQKLLGTPSTRLKAHP